MQKMRNIIVTGSNKGIGYGIVQNLAQKKAWNIIMACRNLEAAKRQREQILQKASEAKIHVQQLDITNKQSIDNFTERIAGKYSSIDVLINNAGIVRKQNPFNQKIAKETFDTNFYGNVNLTDALLKHMANSGKIVFIGAAFALKNMKFGDIVKSKINDPQLTRQQLFDLMDEFMKDVKEGDYAQKGWPKWAYGVSKVGINQFAKVLAKQEKIIKKGIQVYSACPGYVKTDMTGNKGLLTVQQGALTPVYLAELPFEINTQYQGKIFEKSAVSTLKF